MAQRNTEIIKINGTDLISESIEKINTNFESLAEVTSIDKQKWQALMDETKKEIDRLKESNDKKEIVISGLIRDLNDKVDNVPTIDNIQQQVNSAIKNADRELSAVISTLAGQYVNNALGDYAKDADLEKIQTSFESFSADAEKNIATASITAANSKFYTTYKKSDTSKKQQYLVYIDDDKNKEGTSDYKDIYDYYEKNKVTIDPHNKGYGDSDVAKDLLSECEKKFKTTSTEMATIKQTVSDDIAKIDIIATVKKAVDPNDKYNDGDDGKNITAAIFATASENGSEIKLTADNILIDSDNQLKLSTGTFIVNGDNFSVDASGYLTASNASISGEITATSLTIAEPGYQKQHIGDYVESKVSFALNDIFGGSDGNYDWFNGAMHKTTTNGGLVLTGNLLVGDINENITAGVLGANTGDSGNDIRFFAGSNMSDINNAPFKVYANGHLEATDATISGEITANKFSAKTSQSINYDNKPYVVTKSTTITGDTFEIGLSNVHADLNDFSENKVYIKLVNELQDESGTISKEHKLYCVPVLCMKYCGKEYMLSPASWISSPLPAKMWWEKLYDAKCYKRINYTTQRCYFNTEYGKCDMYYDNALIEKTDTGIYQLMYEVDNKEYESEVESILSSTNPPLIDSNSKEGKYELGDRDTGYFVVNDSNCKTFASYLSSNGEEYYGISSNIETKTDINNYGLQKARDFIKKILKDTGGDLTSSYSSVYGWYNGPSWSGSSTSVTFASGDVKKLIPFLSDEEKTNYGGLETNSTIKVDIQYTPIKKLYNGDLTNKVEFIDFTIKYTINCTYASTGTITINNNQYNVSAGEFILKCNCLLKMTTPYDDDNGKPNYSDDAWMIYLPTCFNAIDFSTIGVSIQKEHGVFNFTGNVQISGAADNYIHIDKKPLTS